MDFERRAAKAYDRGDAVRAVILLAEGLKRHPNHRAAAESLVDYYAEGVDSPGLERDVVSGLVDTSEADLHLARIYTRLVDQGREKMARDFERAAREHGYELEAEPPSGDREEPSSERARRESGPDIETVDREAPESERVRDRLRSSPATVDDTASPDDPVSPPTSSSTFPGGDDHRADEREGEEEPALAETTSSVDDDPEGTTEPSEPAEREEEPERVREVEPRGPSGPTEHQPGTGATRWLKRAGIGIAVAGAVAVAGYLIWTRIQPLRVEHSLDTRLTRLDPHQSMTFESTGLAEDAVRERRSFVEAIRAIERGETYSYTDDPTTSWGLSARALSALSRDDLEVAVRASTKLARMQPEDDLARLWTNGRVAEYRGRIETAENLYRRGRVMYPEFVPFLTGAIRVAYARFDHREVDGLVERLQRVAPDHPYRVLAEIAFPRVDVPDPEVEENEREPHVADGAESAFLQSIRTYEDALGALDRGRFERAIERASELVERRDHFGPAIWVRAMGRAALFDVESADADFQRIVNLPGLSPTYQWYLQWVAPTMLTAAGRPDLGAKYVVAGEGPIPLEPRRTGREEASEEARDRKTVVPRTARWSDDAADDEASEEIERLRRLAKLARVRVVVELGHHGRARRLIEGFRVGDSDLQKDIALYRAEIDARRGRRPAGPGKWARESASPEAQFVDAFYSGAFERVIELGDDMLGDDATPEVVRFVALSYAATDRGRRALRTLEEAELSVLARPALDRVRARIVSRLWRRDAPEIRGLDRLETVEPTSTQAAVDLAAVMLWKHRIEAAGTWSRNAWERAPDYPEANWMRGLVLRVRDQGDPSRFLARSWRADGDGARLSMELGYVNLGLDEFERARDLFYSALLADPTSVEAIRGLGRSYHGFSSRKGRWNFERFLENYEEEPSRRVQAAEVDRWLGVFHGVRDGDDTGKKYLDRAVERVGRRPVLLLELARYREARGEREDARRLYIDVLQTDSTVAEAHLGVARVAEATGGDRLMRTHLERYLDLEPAGDEAAWARRQLEELESEGTSGDGGDTTETADGD